LRRDSAFLQATAFLTGMTIMGLEMLASRFLAPYFGTSTYVWATIIGMAMIALSLGYALGGSWADRNPRREGLYRLVTVAAIMVFIIPLGRALPALGHEGALELSWAGFIFGLLGSLALFFVPMMLLAAASPYMIRLAATTLGTVGSTSGRIYSISTIGSIVGVFLTTFVGMPYLGVVESLLAYGVALLVFGLAGSRRALMGALGAALMVASLLLTPGIGGRGVIYQGESVYNYVEVVNSTDGALLLKLNEGIGSQSVYYEDDIYTRGIWDYFIAPALVNPAAEDVLVIGFAGGTVAGQYLALTNASIVGVEIDPLVVRVGRDFFGVEESDRLEVVVADGRTFLTLIDRTYDIILMDAFNPPTIPFHLATREFFELVRAHLNPGGIFAANVPRYGEPAHVIDPICATLESVFEDVLDVDRRTNIPQLVMAFRDGIGLEEFVEMISQNRLATRPRIVEVLSTRTGVFDGGRSLILTDNRSPIEILVHNIIFDFARGGEPVEFE
jgi:spermidine synthase